MANKPTAKPTKSERTRAAILEAARELFMEFGYQAATVRDVAHRASIDPAMVIRYFGSKEELFARAASIRLNVPQLQVVDSQAIGETLVRHFLNLWEGPESSCGMAVLLRSAASNEFAAEKNAGSVRRASSPGCGIRRGSRDSSQACRSGLQPIARIGNVPLHP
ncbi:TetR family transcriptional regulator (plasmid) [Aminobacter sp. Y103A]|uniref:TetR/AcrR family transcriptional regulator n=1 Tax=Aminobacter sp. Y103A TaxID=1870862 RepID=UPI003091FF91|nr:TetR family transcriptional regulator [Aminobacter sp. SS-2016]